MTVIRNEKNDLIPTRTITGWRMCIDYRKLNDAIRKDHFPLPFMDQMLERLAGQSFYCFLDGYSGYNQIVVDLNDKKNTSLNCGSFELNLFNSRVNQTSSHGLNRLVHMSLWDFYNLL